MQMSVRSLELIYTETDWPATEHQLEVSLDKQPLVGWTIVEKAFPPFDTLNKENPQENPAEPSH